MAVSANTLFHFTDKKENLKGILENAFLPKYSLEDITTATPENSSFQTSYIPMVCFCDLLFPQIKSHIDFYGDYGIGLRKKEWGIKKGISPVFYFPEEVMSARLIQSVANSISKEIKIESEQEIISQQLQNFYKCVKPYEGKAFNKRERKLEDRLFYNEREWRFIPKNFPVVPESKMNHRKLKEDNAKLQREELLRFESRDVKYIIVKNDKEIEEFVDFIERKLIQKFEARERKLLLSKLICVDQISDDMVS